MAKVPTAKRTERASSPTVGERTEASSAAKTGEESDDNKSILNDEDEDDEEEVEEVPVHTCRPRRYWEMTPVEVELEAMRKLFIEGLGFNDTAARFVHSLCTWPCLPRSTHLGSQQERWTMQWRHCISQRFAMPASKTLTWKVSRVQMLPASSKGSRGMACTRRRWRPWLPYPLAHS